MTAEEVVPSAPSKIFRSILIYPLKLRVGHPLSKSILFTELRSPKRLIVSIDCIVRGSTYQPVRSNVLVCVEIVCDGFVELCIRSDYAMMCAHDCTTYLYRKRIEGTTGRR